MAISTTINTVLLAGNGSTVVFPYSFPFYNQTDLKVYLFDTLAGGIVSQVLGTNYNISATQDSTGIYPNGGTVIFTSSIVNTTIVAIDRQPIETQTFAILLNGYISSIGLTHQLDYLTLLIQDMADRISRSAALPNGFGQTTNFSPALPSTIGLASSAGQFLAVNASATGLTLSPVSGTSALGAPIGYFPVGTTSQVLTVGSGLIPGWATAVAGGAVGSSALLVVNNLADVASKASAFNNITPASIRGDFIVMGAGSISQSLPAGSSAQVMTSNGPGSIPSWQPAAGGSVGSSALLVINSLSDVASKATAFNNITPASLMGDLIAMGSGLLSLALSAGSSAQVLTSNGPGAIPSWKPATGANAGSSALLVINSLSDVPNKNAGFNNLSPGRLLGDLIVTGSGIIAQALSAGSSAQVLTSTGPNSIPTWQPSAAASAGSSALLVINNLSDVPNKTTAFNNIMPETIWGDIAYAGSGIIGTRLGAGTSGQFLQTAGPGANPTWASIVSSGILYGITTVTASSSALTNVNDTVLCNSAAMIVTLYPPLGNADRRLTIKKIDPSGGIVTITGSSTSVTIDGSSVQLCAQYDSVTLISDGTNWRMMALNLVPINARYTNAAGTSIPNSGDNIVPYATLVYDTHNAFDGTNYTVKFAGKYTVQAQQNYSSNLYAAGNDAGSSIYVNSSSQGYGPIQIFSGAATSNAGTGVSLTQTFNVGDVINSRALNSRTAGPTPLITSPVSCWIEVRRISNS